MDRLTPQQSRQLAAFVASLRRDWERPGIEAALTKARDLAPGVDVAVAAVRAAGIDSNRSPAVIPLPGPHWRESTTAPYFPPVPPHERCSVCGRGRPDCLARSGGDHAFEPDLRPAVAQPTEQLERLRLVHRDTTADLCSHGVRPEHCKDHRPTAVTSTEESA